jgi:hypothetical protein
MRLSLSFQARHPGFPFSGSLEQFGETQIRRRHLNLYIACVLVSFQCTGRKEESEGIQKPGLMQVQVSIGATVL